MSRPNWSYFLRLLNAPVTFRRLTLVGLCLTLGCDSEPAGSSAVVTHADETPADAPDNQAAQLAGPKTVEVGKTGSKFDPPVDKSQIPDGAWMCDMGTVHYASLEKGAGKCPICTMPLVQKSPSP